MLDAAGQHRLVNLVLPSRSLVGETLSFDPDTSDLPASSEQSTFQWLRNGEAIEGADQPNYALTEADLGRTLSLEVAVREQTDEPKVFTSTTVNIPPSAPVETTAVS